MIFKNKNASAKLTADQERLAAGISTSVINSQRRIANKLNAKINSMSTNTVKVGLIVFCGLFGMICLYLIISSLFFT